MRHPPGELHMTWLIARRASIEALRDPLSLLVGLFLALVLPVGLVAVLVRPLAAGGDTSLGNSLAFYLLVIGLAPAASAVGIAAGQFAGEKERGILTPLLASPASNLAIFGGKVLGAVLPSLLYAALAELVYLAGLAVVLGPSRIGVLPPAFSLAIVVLIPGVTCFAATVSSLISARVRTFNAAQQLGGLVLMPVWGVILGLAGKLQDWGPGALFGVVGGLVLVDVALTALGAATWRREEVLSQR
jgi:ABC-type transport system involved in multi-copper enzyme maturation permease subunit